MKEQGPVAFVKEASQFAFWKIAGPLRLYRLFLPSAIRTISAFNIRNLDEAVEFGYSFKHFGLTIVPSQFREEIAELLRLLRDELQPKRLMEIGTSNGGTLFLLCQAASDDATLISLDLPGGRFGGGYPKWKTELYKAFGKGKQEIHLIRGDSHQQSVLNEVYRILKGDKLDFLLVDGDHTYYGVKRDYQMYSPLVRQGGIIAFHDIAIIDVKGFGLDRFWNEVKVSHHTREIVKDWQQRYCGIGLLYV
jgi:predicted O-methyltransferase YrrM